MTLIIVVFALMVLGRIGKRPGFSQAESHTGLGAIVTVKSGKWPCASTTQAYDQIMKWAAAGDSGEMLRVLRTTRSFLLIDNYRVKILQSGFTKSRVRVAGFYDPDDQRVHVDQEIANIGRECWVPNEALP